MYVKDKKILFISYGQSCDNLDKNIPAATFKNGHLSKNRVLKGAFRGLIYIRKNRFHSNCWHLVGETGIKGVTIAFCNENVLQTAPVGK